jgi:hypothetical protein
MGRDDRRDTTLNLDALINERLEKIEKLKESLSNVRGISEEMALLRHLNHEIIELRELRDRQFSGPYH